MQKANSLFHRQSLQGGPAASLVSRPDLAAIPPALRDRRIARKERERILGYGPSVFG